MPYIPEWVAQPPPEVEKDEADEVASIGMGRCCDRA